MSRKKPDRPPAQRMGVVYTLHLLPGFGDERQMSRHYTGFATDLPARLAEHENGSGARLLQLQKEAGGTWVLASWEPGTVDREIQLKYRGAVRRCPVCKAEKQGIMHPAVQELLDAQAAQKAPPNTRVPSVGAGRIDFPAENPLQAGTVLRVPTSRQQPARRRRLPPLPAGIPAELPF